MNEYLEFFATLLLVGGIAFSATLLVALYIILHDWDDNPHSHHEDFY